MVKKKKVKYERKYCNLAYKADRIEYRLWNLLSFHGNVIIWTVYLYIIYLIYDYTFEKHKVFH